jgi:hypothetical protein
MSQPSRRWSRAPITGRRLRLESLEARDVPATALYATGAGPGGGPHVIVRNAADAVVGQFMAFDANFSGGVQVATGDVNNDGVADVIVGAGPGMDPRVRVLSGAALLAGQFVDLYNFDAYQADFSGGVFVAAGDVNGDGFADIVTGAGAGGTPHVKVFSGQNGSELASFWAYHPDFRGGVTVAADDLGGDNGDTPGGIGDAEILTGAGPGGGPHVRAFDLPTPGGPVLQITSFYAFEESWRGGVFVGSGFVTNNTDSSGFRFADIIVGRGPGGAPEVRDFRLLDAPNNPDGTPDFRYVLAADFNAYADGVTFGVRVTAENRGGNVDDIITGVGPGGGPHVRVWSGQAIADLQTFTPSLVSEYFAYNPNFHGGVFVGGGQRLHTTD